VFTFLPIFVILFSNNRQLWTSITACCILNPGDFNTR
jgi:hypothetical protein